MFVAGVIWNLRPPKGSGKKKFLTTPADSEPSTPAVPTLAEQISYLHYARPFKNLNYTKNVNRRTKNLKAVLTQERERERLERERRRLEREEKMDVDGEPADITPEEDLPTCEFTPLLRTPSRTNQPQTRQLKRRHLCSPCANIAILQGLSVYAVIVVVLIRV
ncbi:hypothetical protein PHLCEN_2v6418 [Hermanssonia centrifuga]|uniref:Uncharacterized protein n=1 Tax=Hermanssonia centrifuga TaxID=98765 RepID=A0A2R6P082_9APHY|nr:hypothetical protein PHLCEN_2v6418 [Hermanssonia centrifuga]